MAVSYESTFGVLAITAVVSSFLTGVTTLQTYIYILNYKKDPLKLKILVAIVLSLAISHSVMLEYASYHYTVKAFGNPLSVLKIHWSALVALLIASTQIFVAQLFLARRVHKFMASFMTKWRASAWFGLFLICILCNFVSSLTGIAKVFTLENVSEIFNIRTYFLITLSFNITVDTLVTAFLAWALLSSKTGQKQSDEVVRQIALLSINTGLLPALLATAGLISYIRSPDTFWFLFFTYLISDTYANSLLANLNSRTFFAEKLMSPHRTPPSQRVSGTGAQPSSVVFAVSGNRRNRSTNYGDDIELEVNGKSLDPHYVRAYHGDLPRDLQTPPHSLSLTNHSFPNIHTGMAV
ncbi:hypothetical protein V5O48_002237 [Marasmius crinis-equi]|uniref:DUF6534 domain-containing protein n=1 Tax=Marasmius crinis-equi TaxID=585013 RepID=A0ABR3FWN3_9AGAR